MGLFSLDITQRLDKKDVIHFREVLMSKNGGSRPKGRPKLRWEDQMAEDTARAGCRNWKTTAHNREDWQKLLKEAKAHPGL
jgi:hypothetical protein